MCRLRLAGQAKSHLFRLLEAGQAGATWVRLREPVSGEKKLGEAEEAA